MQTFRLISSFWLLPLAFVAVGCAPPNVHVHPEGTHALTVTGQGEATSAPDMGIVRLGVEERADTAEQAMKLVSQRMEAILAAVKAKGVKPEEVQTTDLSMYFERHPDAPVPPPEPIPRDEKGKDMSTAATKMIGFYVARNTVIVSVREIDNLGAVIGAAMEAGANHMHGFELTIEDPTKLRDEARKAAVKNAMEKAKQLASEAKIELGSVIRVSEVGGPAPVPMMADKRMNAMAESSVPVEQGELTLTQSVEVIFAIDD